LNGVNTVCWLCNSLCWFQPYGTHQPYQSKVH